jgi:hypothetical protein
MEMTYRTYQLPNGSFVTTSVNIPPEYSAVFDITPEQAHEIERGCGLYVEDGVLVVVPLVESEPDPVIPQDGDF